MLLSYNTKPRYLMLILKEASWLSGNNLSYGGERSSSIRHVLTRISLHNNNNATSPGCVRRGLLSKFDYSIVMYIISVLHLSQAPLRRVSFIIQWLNLGHLPYTCEGKVIMSSSHKIAGQVIICLNVELDRPSGYTQCQYSGLVAIQNTF